MVRIVAVALLVPGLAWGQSTGTITLTSSSACINSYGNWVQCSGAVDWDMAQTGEDRKWHSVAHKLTADECQWAKQGISQFGLCDNLKAEKPWKGLVCLAPKTTTAECFETGVP